MAVNDLSFNQLATVLNAITQQATGKAELAATNTNEFVSIAQKTLKTGYDPVLGAISQILGRTIFANRPYARRFKGLEATSMQYGNHVRKINIADKPFENDSRNSLTDGQSIDQYTVNKPEILQTNIYGANQYQKSVTIFKDQLDCAFSSVDEFQRFLSMVTANTSDMIEQAHESTARATLANFIGGKVAGDADSVIHLLTEYNALTGLSLTATDVYQPANFKPLMQWAYSRIAALCALLTERSLLWHTNVTGKDIMRHTPYVEQCVYLYAPARYGVEAQVLADTYHDNYLKMATTETLNFWQAINSPGSINVKASYLAADGTVTTAAAAAATNNIFGVIHDREAVGYTVVNQWSQPTPFNAKGGYSNVFYHFTDRYWNDFTENGIILLLD